MVGFHCCCWKGANHCESHSSHPQKIFNTTEKPWPKHAGNRRCTHLNICTHIWGWWEKRTSSTAQGGGGSFNNRKPIGKVGCCESRMAERSHWWIERWLMSPLFLSLSLTIYLPTYLYIYLCIYRSIYLPIFLSIYLSIYLAKPVFGLRLVGGGGGVVHGKVLKFQK